MLTLVNSEHYAEASRFSAGVSHGKWFDEIIMLKLENGDTANYPVERNGKAGGARTLKNQYQSRLVPPLNRRHSTKLSHSSSTDIHEIIEHINDRISRAAPASKAWGQTAV